MRNPFTMFRNWQERRAKWYQGGDPQSPQYWVKKLFGATDTDAGIDLDQDKVLTYSAVWNAVNIIAGAIGFLPLITYKSKGGDSKERARGTSIYKLLHDRPNPYMDALTFKETLQSHVLIWGNGYAEIERNGAGNPLYLWPLLPNKVRPKVLDGKLIYEIDKADGGQTILRYENMFHIKGLGFDGLKGYPVINYAANNLALGMAVEKFGSKFFSNDATPGGVIELDGALSDKAYKQTKETLQAEHGGLDKSHRTLILQHGMKWHQISVPPETAQFLESRKFSISDVARWFDVPVHMLKELDRATYSNIEHQGLEFITWTLLKWLRRWELECNYKLFSTVQQQTMYAEFLVDALLRADTKTRYDAYRVGRMAGFLSINDVRRRENMNPVKNGDTYLEPLNMKPVGEPFVPKAKGAGFRNLMESTWDRILTKEVNAIGKAANKPEAFEDWRREFYSAFCEHIEHVLAPVLLVCIPDADARQVAEQYVHSHNTLIDSLLSKQDGEKLSDLLRPTLETWRLSEPVERAGLLLGDN